MTGVYKDGGGIREELLWEAESDRYAIYQIGDESPAREVKFMGWQYAVEQRGGVSGSDYEFIYGGELGWDETLDSLYAKFNIGHPADYRGHSLSVSDVVAMRKGKDIKAYYVDMIGFKEIPNFVGQRMALMGEGGS